MRKHSTKFAAVPVALALVVASCGSDDGEDAGAGDDPEETIAEVGSTSEGTAAEGGGDFEGAEITVTGPERDDPSVAAISDALSEFGDANNINISYAGDADWEANINTQVEGGNPPDISIFPQPGKLADFANEEFIVPLSDEVNATIDEVWDEKFAADGEVDGTQFGVPVKTDLKSLVWYKPAAFEEAGYEIPQTIEEFNTLMDTMKDDGGPAPLCVGIESGQATGWPFTDWTEEMVLRQAGPDVYDQWISHEIPFNDPQIVEAMQAVVDFWDPENVFAAGGSIAATNFGDNAQPLVDDQCWMHRQANFFAGFFPAGTAFADPENPDAIDVFYFPDINDDSPVLTAGTLAAAFNDDPATMAVLNYMAGPEYASTRQRIQTEQLDGGVSGFLSAAQGQDEDVYQPLEQGFLEILNSSELSRFDGSDQMPSEVGAGTFWEFGTSLVNGEIDAQTAADRIEESWPS